MNDAVRKEEGTGEQWGGDDEGHSAEPDPSSELLLDWWICGRLSFTVPIMYDTTWMELLDMLKGEAVALGDPDNPMLWFWTDETQKNPAMISDDEQFSYKLRELKDREITAWHGQVWVSSDEKSDQE